MDDLGAALSGDRSMVMLGGGNPGHIAEFEQLLRQRMVEIAGDQAEFARMVGNYAGSQGETRFLKSLARLLRNEFGWDIGPGNIALTAGSQGGFFLLFNLLAGEFDDGSSRRILLPMIPEYVGYKDIGLSEGFFQVQRPSIEYLDDRMFKYHVDFEQLKFGEDIGAICVSRPTNPTGNVLTDVEIRQLDEIARHRQVPLIIDSAYGTPFPNMIFSDAETIWNDNIILCMSLSKIGMPAIRTGIVIANEEIIDAIVSMNAIVNLAVSSVGAVLLQQLVDSGDIIRLSRELITPFYRDKAARAVDCLRKELDGVDYHIHKPEGAMFLWLWFPGLAISSAELYQRLKARGVVILSGEHFFPGVPEDWRHQRECIRLTYAQPAEVVQKGIRIIAEEVKRVHTQAA